MMAGMDSRHGWIIPGAKPAGSLRPAAGPRQRYIRLDITGAASNTACQSPDRNGSAGAAKAGRRSAKSLPCRHFVRSGLPLQPLEKTVPNVLFSRAAEERPKEKST
jgi:hypothetical protein